MAGSNVSMSRIVGTLVVGNLCYFALMFVLFRLLPRTPKEPAIFHWLPVLYFIVPAALSLLELLLSGILPMRSFSLRTISLVAWSLVLPGLLFFVILCAAMYACHMDWLPGCLAYW